MPELVPAAAADSAVEAASPSGAAAPRHPAIEVRDLAKTFRIPKEQIHTLKERALHPFRGAQHDELEVLRRISFDVHHGEFFGIVGRNGSGKSTLLKCLAGIYRADSGTIRAAGRISPFIELGVGFNPDLTARENVVINAVMMGLSPREARDRFDDILAFAELERFVDMKLKNYSSGMQVRLAFAVMVQSGSEILLIDEVLAVGDAAFQQRCMDEFTRLHREGRTVVLVTHDMEMVRRFCDRAMLITDGEIETIGAPDLVGHRYLERNFESFRTGAGEPEAEVGQGGPRGHVADVWLENGAGERIDTAAHGERLHVHALIDVNDNVREPVVDFWIDDEDDARLMSASTRGWPEQPPLAPGERVHVTVDLENRFRSGRYHVGCSLLAGSRALDVIALANRFKPFVVYAGDHVYGSVWFEHELRVDREQRRP